MRITAAALCLIAICGLGEAQSDPDPKDAQFILKAAGSGRGIAVVMDDERLAIGLARKSGLTLYVIASHEGRLAPARKAVESAGFTASRIRIELGPPEKLEYPDFAANLIVCPVLPPQASLRDLWRMLRPEGFMFIGSRDPVEAALKAASIEHVKVLDRTGAWLPIRRSRLEGSAEWTHHDYDPSQNRYSPDAHVRAPLRPLWYTRPASTRGSFWASHGLTAGGRIFMTGQSPSNPKRARVTALDAYNGVELWARDVGTDRYTRVRGVSGDSATWVR